MLALLLLIPAPSSSVLQEATPAVAWRSRAQRGLEVVLDYTRSSRSGAWHGGGSGVDLQGEVRDTVVLGESGEPLGLRTVTSREMAIQRELGSTYHSSLVLEYLEREVRVLEGEELAGAEEQVRILHRAHLDAGIDPERAIAALDGLPDPAHFPLAVRAIRERATEQLERLRSLVADFEEPPYWPRESFDLSEEEALEAVRLGYLAPLEVRVRDAGHTERSLRQLLLERHRARGRDRPALEALDQLFDLGGKLELPLPRVLTPRQVAEAAERLRAERSALAKPAEGD